MKKITSTILALSSTLFINGCNDDNDNQPIQAAVQPPVTQAEPSYLRVIHGSADAPKVNVLAGGAVIAGLESVDFTQGSAFLSLDEGSYGVTVDGILPDGSTTQVLDLGSLDLMSDYQYTVIAHGYVMDDGDSTNDLATAVISNMRSDIGEGNIRLQVLHAAPNAPTVDLHVTAADDDLGAPLATLAYGDVTGQVEVSAGVYRVRLAIPEGTDGAGTVAYDVVLPELGAGSDWFISAVPNTGVPTSPVVLLASNGADTLKFIDDRTQSWVRVTHTAADVPNVDILVNGSKVDALSNLGFNKGTGYVPLDAGDYQVDTVLTADNAVVGISGELSVMADYKYSVLAVGTLAVEDATDVELEYFPLMDNSRKVATESQLRLTHAHPSVGNVDIYITADGNIDDVSATFADVPYQASTGFVAVAPGDYVVKVTAAGDKSTVAIDTGMVTLQAGGVYSAVALNDPMSVPANLLLQDDFTAM